MGGVSADALRAWVCAVLTAHEMPPDHAALVGQALVDADLRGIDTHGVRQLPTYVALLRRGAVRARPDLRFETKGSLLTVQADRGFGQVVGTLAVDAAVDIARRTGCAIATIAEVGHLGALGYFTRRAADAGMAALLMQNGPPLMALPGSTQRAIGNNPLSFAAPLDGRPPVVFDMAASTASFGKIIGANAAGKALPDGWALDKDGEPTNDARKALDGMLLPIAGVKGIGLAMMVQSFAGSLSGTKPVWGEGIFGGFLLLVDPEATIGRAAFLAHMAEWVGHYTEASTDGRIPGDRGIACQAARRETGIPLPQDVIDLLAKAGTACGVPFTGDSN